MNSEHALLCELILGGDPTPVTDVRLTEEFFSDDLNRKVFKLIIDHFLTYGKVPDESVVLDAYPTFDVIGYPEPLTLYVDSVRDRYLKRKLWDGLGNLNASDFNEGTDQGQRLYEELAELLIQTRTEVPVGQDDDLFATTWDYLKPTLDHRRQFGALQGAPTGFNSIDTTTRGLQKEQLVTLIGLPKSGKSSVLLKIALNLSMSGRRILFVTFEMSNDEQRDRTASLLSGVSLTNILTGQLLPAEMKTLEDSFTKLKGLEGFFTLVYDRSSMTTLTGVQAKIREYSPDAVFIDGVYMMDDENGEPPGSPRALTNLTRGLKRMAQNNKIPVVISTQALSHKSRGGVTADSAGYSSSFVQDSDVVLGVETVKENEMVKYFKVLLSRSGPTVDSHILVNWNEGEIIEIDAALVPIAGMSSAVNTRSSSIEIDDDDDIDPTASVAS